ncbi:MAG: Hint domain-containing protein, partial [Cypionkella sp.]
DDLIYGGYGAGVPDAVNIPDDAGDLLPSNGRDDIRGGLGNDTIYGQDDDDTIDGGQGADLIYGGVDDDVVTGGADNDTVYGDAGNDTLFGNRGDDSLFGGDGNDLVEGGAGNDVLSGGEGLDTLSGGNDRDTFIINAPTAGLGDFIDGNEGGDDYDTLDLRGSGPFNIIYAADNPENGTVDFLDADGNTTGTLTFANIENVIPCFTPGTLIATPKGEIAVEDLHAGDRVITRDNGIQEIRWTGRKDMGWHDLAANPHLKPVLIRQGSLGNGLPERDMMVSPNHRVLVANDRTSLYFDEHEVLVSAKHLVSSQGITAINAVGASYIHFMFDRHEVVLSNGAWTESFQPGDYTLKGMGNAQRSEIYELFPELQTEAGLSDYQAARRTLKKHEAKLLVK